METIIKTAKHILGHRIRSSIENYVLDRTINRNKFFIEKILPKILYEDVFVAKGKLKDGHVPLTAIFVGDERKAHYSASLMFSSGDLKITNVGRKSFSSIFSFIEKMKVDFCLINAEKTLVPILCKKGFLILPKLDFILDVTKSWNQIFESLSRRRRRDIKTISKLPYSYEISKSYKELAYFYYKMYLPFVFSRHGKSTMERTIETLKDMLKNGGILFIKKDGVRIAGIFYYIDEKRANLDAVCFGVKEQGNEEIRKYSSQITLLSLIEWAKKNEIKTLNYGITSPFFNNGLFIYKKEWGMHIKCADDRSTYALKLCNFNESVKEFLKKTPFIIEISGRLYGVMFFDAAKKISGDEIVGFIKQRFVRGLTGSILLFDEEISNGVLKVLRGQMKIRKLRQKEISDMYCLSAFSNLTSEGFHLYEAS